MEVLSLDQDVPEEVVHVAREWLVNQGVLGFVKRKLSVGEAATKDEVALEDATETLEYITNQAGTLPDTPDIEGLIKARIKRQNAADEISTLVRIMSASNQVDSGFSGLIKTYKDIDDNFSAELIECLFESKAYQQQISSSMPSNVSLGIIDLAFVLWLEKYQPDLYQIYSRNRKYRRLVSWGFVQTKSGDCLSGEALLELAQERDQAVIVKERLKSEGVKSKFRAVEAGSVDYHIDLAIRLIYSCWVEGMGIDTVREIFSQPNQIPGVHIEDWKRFIIFIYDFLDSGEYR